VRHPLDIENGYSNLELLVRQAKDEISGWRATIQKDIEAWCHDKGFTPARAEDTLALVDGLKTRGVKSFEGLGIKVTL
jgi:hypothetical protein